MVKPIEFYNSILQAATEPGILTLSLAPLVVETSAANTMAAKLLLWLYDEMPEDATVGDMLNALSTAHWWATFWSSLGDSEETSEEQVPAGSE